MLHYFRIGFLLFMCFQLVSCNSQISEEKTERLPDDFDSQQPFGYKMPTTLTARDTSPGWNKKGRKIMLTGTVFQRNGKTPAKNVILYYYHTNSSGVYATEKGHPRNMPKNTLGQTHGYMRGWLQTDANGTYTIYTILPGSYPSRNEAAHIHVTVKEPDLDDVYYIDNFTFDDDTLLTTERRKKMENRGGSGVIRFVDQDGLWVGERNIILGLNIPDYPKDNITKPDSGKSIGESIFSFTPYHAYGPDKGTKTCPICKYGWYQGILYFVGNHPNWTDIKEWLSFLDAESLAREKHLKVYFVYGNETDYQNNRSNKTLARLGAELNLQTVALTVVPSFSDISSEIHLNEINPEVENTFLIYKRSTIIENYVNLRPTQENFDKIKKRLEETVNPYFDLPRPKKN
ncbi:MAG: intradiol ring-cleavage dioxygenase [Flavobacteriaceae bacterium]|nr:intradiol ring-cleavage dioxygenase [Flavobacteriaceae bacterium]MAY53784.1 intradiol ring-cleavage dioxygenase [Flavobacteriaceae bacterium]